MNMRKRMMRSPVARSVMLFVFLLTFFGLITTADAATRYARPGGAVAGACASWATACDLQYAISVAVPGDEVWVQAGTHLPTAGTNRAISFGLKNGVAVYGGFNGAETAREQRSPADNATVLSGDIGVSGDAADNSYHVVATSGLNSSSVLDGFTITGGNANGIAQHSSGGGMQNSNSSPALSNITFVNNSAGLDGGGMYNAGSSPALSNCTFAYNTAGLQGGGIYDLNSSPVLTNITMYANTAGLEGGGIYNLLSSPSLVNVTFSGNSSELEGGGAYNLCSSPVVRNSIFWGNISDQFIGHGSFPVISSSIIQGGCPDGGSCAALLTVDPNLGSLGDYGGATQTMPLFAGSSAIDTGDNAFCPLTDQRGISRPQNGVCDRGAYEFPWPVTYSVTPSTGPNGTVSPNTIQTVVSGASITFTVTANAGYKVASVTGCNGNLSGGTYTTGAITGDCTVTASFAALVQYNITVGKAGPGVVTSGTGSISCGSACSASFTEGTTVSLTATPNADYRFVGWSGGAAGNVNPLVISNIQAPVSVTATFAPINITVPVTDIFWRNLTTGAVAIWTMNGVTQTGYVDVDTAPLSWIVSGIGDFNTDLMPDILWRNTADGAVAIWTTNGTSLTGLSYIDSALMTWKIVGAGDFNGDYKPDILWQNTGTGEIVIWLMDGLKNTGFSSVGSAPLDWKVVGIGDFNADNSPDILWQNSTTGLVAVWYMNGVNQVGFDAIGAGPDGWKVAGVGDFTGDQKPDILWRNETTGDMGVWIMNGVTQTGYSAMGGAPLEWEISAVY